MILLKLSLMLQPHHPENGTDCPFSGGDDGSDEQPYCRLPYGLGKQWRER